MQIIKIGWDEKERNHILRGIELVWASKKLAIKSKGNKWMNFFTNERNSSGFQSDGLKWRRIPK